MSVDIKFDDKVQALLLFSSLPESWEDIVGRHRRVTRKLLLSAEDKGRGRKAKYREKDNRSRSIQRREVSPEQRIITCWNCNQKGHFQNQCSKPVTSRDKEVNMAARDYDDALVCCVENTIDDRIIDSSASFHATYCEEELECSGKVRLADDKTLDIAGIGDVVLKTYFGTSWTLKDVRYIPGLKKRLISVGQLDEEGYHVGFRDQQWKVTKGSLVVARGNKRGSMYMVEVPSDRINAAIDGLPKMFWEDSVTTAAYLINRGPSVPLGFRIPEEEWQGKEVSLAHLRVMQMRWDIAFGIRRVTRSSEAEMSHLNGDLVGELYLIDKDKTRMKQDGTKNQSSSIVDSLQNVKENKDLVNKR
ncbi:retrovirus-related pol polyprotein from transposon TNT 1-94 [Tanacetum coccineum]